MTHKIDKTYIQIVAAILTTAREIHPRPIPRSYPMLALEIPFEAYMAILGAMERSGLIGQTSDTITLTSKGLVTAQEVEKAIAG